MNYFKRNALSLVCGLIFAAESNLSEAAGIAYVQVPEQMVEYCIGSTQEEAIRCATKKCLKSGVSKSECIVQSWCSHAQWSVEIFMQSKQGPHYYEFFCGLTSKAEAKSVAAIICKSPERQLDACMISRLISPSGAELESNRP